MSFGKPRITNPIQDSIEYFIDELGNELLLIQLYLYDMDSYLRKKKESIAEELKDEDKEIRMQMLKQPNYRLYENKFNELLTKNIFITLISRFETSLLELIDQLRKDKIINRKFPKTNENIIRKSIIFLESELKLNKFCMDNFQFFILLRNRIIHSDSKITKTILSHKSFGIFEDYITIEKNVFDFKNIGINLFLLKEITTFFNSVESQVSQNSI